jgi:hypothetical protein
VDHAIIGGNGDVEPVPQDRFMVAMVLGNKQVRLI